MIAHTKQLYILNFVSLEIAENIGNINPKEFSNFSGYSNFLAETSFHKIYNYFMRTLRCKSIVFSTVRTAYFGTKIQSAKENSPRIERRTEGLEIDECESAEAEQSVNLLFVLVTEGCSIYKRILARREETVPRRPGLVSIISRVTIRHATPVY